MPVEYSLIPTDDLLALRNMDYGAVSTATLRYLKTGDASVIGGGGSARSGSRAAGREAPGPDRIERSTGAGTVHGLATSSQRPRETILGVEGVPAQGSDIQPQLRNAPGFLKRAGEDIAAVEDIPGTLIGQAIAFPVSKVGGAEGAAIAGKGPRLPSGAEVEQAIRLGAPVSAEHMRAYPDLLKRYERSFVRTRSGNIDFGVIDKRISPDLPEGPIRLQRGVEGDIEHQGFGEFHVDLEKGERIRAEGFPDTRAFIEDTVNGATQIWAQPNGRLMLVKKNGKDHLAVVEFERRGGFYGVTTAFPTHDMKYAARGGRTLIYEGQPLGSLWGGK